MKLKKSAKTSHFVSGKCCLSDMGLLKIFNTAIKKGKDLKETSVVDGFFYKSRNSYSASDLITDFRLEKFEYFENLKIWKILFEVRRSTDTQM